MMARLKLLPIKGNARVSSPWGSRTHPVTGARGAHHNGIDFAVPPGTPLIACDDGVVDFVLVDKGEPAATTTTPSGNAVGMRRADGVKWSYSHMSRVDVRSGQKLVAGTVIGLSGTTGRSTGPHLHFVVRAADGKDVDPATMLPGMGGGGPGLGALVVVVGLVAGIM